MGASLSQLVLLGRLGLVVDAGVSVLGGGVLSRTSGLTAIA